MTPLPEPRFGIELGGWLSASERAAAAQRAEELGFDDVVMPEVGDPDAFVSGTLILNATERVRFGTCIAQVGPRSVPMLAVSAATMASAFPGRFALGIGVSSQAIVEGWHGVPWGKPVTRMAEAVEILRALFRGEKTNHAGPEVPSKGFRLAYPPEQPPEIHVAALNERMMRLAARVADGVWLNFLPRERAEHVVDIIRREASDHGRPPPEILISLPCYITDDSAAAEAKVRDMLTFYMTSPAYRRAFAWHGFSEAVAAVELALQTRDKQALRAAITRDMADSISLIGRVGEVRARLDVYREAGVTTVCVGPEDEKGLGIVFDELGKPLRHGVSA